MLSGQEVGFVLRVSQGVKVERPLRESGNPRGNVEQRGERVRHRMDVLLFDVPVQQDDRSVGRQVRWLLVYMFERHRREDGVNSASSESAWRWPVVLTALHDH